MWVRSPEPLCFLIKRTEWDSNPRGLSPTRFPIVRLKPLGHPSRRHFACLVRDGGSGMGLALLGRLASGSAQTHFASCFAVRVGSIPRTSLAFPLTEGVGFEPTRSFRTNALA